MRFTMRRCVKHNDPSSLQTCKETYNLYYYQTDSDIANEMMPAWDDSSYTLVKKIAATHLFSDHDDFRINEETFEIALDTGLKGIYFAFQDTGSCVTLISIRIYYIMCPNMTNNYAFFKETPTGNSPSALEEQRGKCVANAGEGQDPPTYLCSSDGTWIYPQQTCLCMPGYEGYGGSECIGKYIFIKC